jgi:hypothetical protein
MRVGGAEDDSRLVVGVPMELNLVWFLAHAAAWCPYGTTECPMFGDPVVESFAEGPGALSPLTLENLKTAWAAQVKQHVQGVPPDAVLDPLPPPADPGVKDALIRIGERFGPWWYSNLGPSRALEWFEQNTVSHWRSDPRWAFPHWRHAVDVRSLLIVGTEDALVHRGRVAVVGALALLRPGRVFELLT